MGLIKQLIRYSKRQINNVFGVFFKKKKASDDEQIIVPRSWQKPEKAPEKADKKAIIVRYKRKVPGLRQLNRILAAFLLIINFVFSQFLLGSIGAATQPVFFIFLGNCYIIIKYLWLSRKKEE